MDLESIRRPKEHRELRQGEAIEENRLENSLDNIVRSFLILRFQKRDFIEELS